MNVSESYKKILGNIKETDLRAVSETYPYFSPVLFFRLAQSKQEDAGYSRLAAKTSLHFKNPYLLNLRLLEEQSVKSKKMQPVPMEQQTVSDPAFPDMLFEPLHTTDYFASQGIKLSRDISENDKLGKQLKSFTDWLKSMKKLPDAETIASLPLDKAVEKMAAGSDKEVEVITEAMAEVLAGQGKPAKAREIYLKLSLQNPDKKAYFAAKIEDLNKK